jgi:prepilin-type processing-associated H-X9-DG protein
MSPSGQAKEWVRSIVKTKAAPATVELITDVTASNGPNRDTADFSKAQGGCWDRWQVLDRSNHLKGGSTPTGGNIAFVDGHVQWRSFAEMELRWPWNASGNPCFWW